MTPIVTASATGSTAASCSSGTPNVRRRARPARRPDRERHADQRAGDRRGAGSRSGPAGPGASGRRRARGGRANSCRRDVDARQQQVRQVDAGDRQDADHRAREHAGTACGSGRAARRQRLHGRAEPAAVDRRCSRSLITRRDPPAPAPTVTPGFSRPIPNSVLPQLRGLGRDRERRRAHPPRCPGVNIASKSKLAAARRRSVVGWSFSVMVRPTTAGSPPKRRCQKAWLRMRRRGPWKRALLGVEVAAVQERHAERRQEVVGDAELRSRSGSPVPVMVGAQIVGEREVRRRATRSSVLPVAPALERVRPRRAIRQTARRRCSRSRRAGRARANGSGFSTTALTMPNMAVQAPMPSASVAMATNAKPGARRSCRTANRRSLMRRFDVAAGTGVAAVSGGMSIVGSGQRSETGSRCARIHLSEPSLMPRP